MADHGLDLGDPSHHCGSCLLLCSHVPADPGGPKEHVLEGTGQKPDLLGYGVDESSEQINEIYVPNNFDETFYAFNNDIKAQGFDLEKIKGETIKRYMYKAASGENISIFVYNNTLVGYDIRED